VAKEGAPAAAAGNATLVQKFYQELPDELAQIRQAIDREDREQIKEVAQLVLGKAAAAGLKDVAPQAAKLLRSAESERSWMVLRQAVSEFAQDTQPESKSAAA
jgi:HPt (histidine-containing phosphotransfer) domain-containing protein